MRLKCIFMVFFCFVVSNLYAQEYKGYVKERIELFNGGYILDQGEYIKCNLNKSGKCCFEEEFGKVCVDVTSLSKEKIDKIDIKISEVKYSDSLSINTCKDGNDISVMEDGYQCVYSVSLDGISGNDVYLDASYYLVDGNGRYLYTGITKNMIIDGSSKCNTIYVTRDDIGKFFNKFGKLKKYIGSDFYTSSVKNNIKAQLVIQVFSKNIEGDYSNNKITLDVFLPVDSPGNWPQ